MDEEISGLSRRVFFTTLDFDMYQKITKYLPTSVLLIRCISYDSVLGRKYQINLC